MSKIIAGGFDELPEEKQEKPEKTGKAGARLFYPLNWLEPPPLTAAGLEIPGALPTMRILGGATVRQAYKMAAMQGILARDNATCLQEMADSQSVTPQGVLVEMTSEIADAMIAEDDAHEKEEKNGV